MYSYNDRIKYSEVGADLRLSYFDLVNYMQNCSCFHSDDRGVGLEYLMPKHLGWFVTGYEIHINKMPEYSKKVKVSTWPYQVRGMMARRMYSIESEDGEVLCYADSLWVLMDLEKAKPARLTTEIIEAYPKEETLPDFEFSKSKLFAAEGLKSAGKFVVAEQHLDTNLHMNNSYYIDVTAKYLPEGDYKHIAINYKKAALLGEELDVLLADVDGGYQVVLKKDDEVYTIVEYR